jgi:ribosomal protein S18 acetylase RimI-like enzyme
MKHILDNPVWNALISGNKNLSNGNETAKYFAREVSPFVGIKEINPRNFETLRDIIPFESIFGFISPEEIAIPNSWKVIHHMNVFQMVYDQPAGQVSRVQQGDQELVALSEQDVSQMLALTNLTNPGPFASKTIDFGHYKGIFNGNQLVAMAGQRLHAFAYAEISAVCTHPDYSGKGYASRLILDQVRRIHAESEIPFLHVLTENARAIKIYSNLGFVIRKELSVYTIEKN